MHTDHKDQASEKQKLNISPHTASLSPLSIPTKNAGTLASNILATGTLSAHTAMLRANLKYILKNEDKYLCTTQC